MGELLLELESRGVEKLEAQRFILQCVLAMFAEDRNLLPRDTFISCLDDCLKGESSYDVLGNLFHAMNQPGKIPAGRYKGVDYFNGGLFAKIDRVELTKDELNSLAKIAKENWGQVRPAIFGSLFESTVDKKERHAKGIHFTSEADIMRVVRPTISRYWEEKIEQATTLTELYALQIELRNYRILDPACGSGNFLYIAYQELKRIELWLLEKISQRQRKEDKQLEIGFVTPLQFYGMDTNLFAVELAKVTMAIAKKIAIDNFELTEPTLPLDTLDNNIVCQDALFNEWQQADAIIGNPPFLGGKYLRKNLGDKYINEILNKFSDVKDSVDLCTYWFRLAHDCIDEKGRVGLVGTNSISQGKSRNASLNYIIKNGGYIHEAVSTQPWSGEANVHVSIVNWSKDKFETSYLDNQIVSKINSSLKSTTDVSLALYLKANANICFQGVIPVGKGFILTEEHIKYWLEYNPNNKTVCKRLLDAVSLTHSPCNNPRRWIIDFNDMNIEEASRYVLPFQHLKKTVKPERENNRRETTRENWWKFGEKRPIMRKKLTNLAVYFSIPRHSKWFIFVPAQSDWLPADSTSIVALEDFYILGILTSNIHRTWVKAQGSTLEDRIRYTHNTCFETFPFPQNISVSLAELIRLKAKELIAYRTEQMTINNCGITHLYNAFFHESTSRLYKLHKEIDELTMQAYNFNKTNNVLENLLEINLNLAERERSGLQIIGPYDPNT